jgi:ATP-dependent Clp protease ATP-binding subunit ClpC
VGKTELARALAAFLFDSDEAIVRVDMSEYQERHTVSRMIGAPPGYVGYDEGGQLTEAVRRRPYQVVLFDEIEKAHPEVFNALLQILDDGRLTDGHGRTVDFRNTLIIMTSNVGTQHVRQQGPIGFFAGQSAAAEARDRELMLTDLRKTFRPEFLNRVDEIIVFQSLTQEQIGQIVDLMVSDLRKRLKDDQIEVVMTMAAREWLGREGYDPAYGARPLRRVIQRSVENVLSKHLLKGDFKSGDTVLVDVAPEGGLAFRKAAPDLASAA